MTSRSRKLTIVGLAVCVSAFGCAPRTTVRNLAGSSSSFAPTSGQRSASPLLEEGVKCVEPRFGGTDNESFQDEAVLQFLSEELEKRGVGGFETLSLGDPPVKMLRTQSGEVFEYSVQLEPVGTANGKQCFKGVVTITPSSRDYAAEKAKLGQLFGTTTATAADCRGDSALCRWVEESFGIHAKEVKAILSDLSIRVVEDYEGEIDLMAPSSAVAVSPGAVVRGDAVGGAQLFLGSGTVYYLPPCSRSEPKDGMSSISIFVPSGGSLADKNEVEEAFSSGDVAFWPTFNASLIHTEFSSGDLLYLRQYELPSWPLSFSKSKQKLRERFVAMGSSESIVGGVDADPCYVEALRHQSGQGVLLVIGKERREAFVWRH
jgi:hypothetical protein